MPDKEIERPATICVECASHVGRGSGNVRESVWYDHFCKANPRRKVVDPVTGVEGYGGVNDLGGTYITNEPYRYCRDLNKGMCPLFQPKEKR